MQCQTLAQDDALTQRLSVERVCTAHLADRLGGIGMQLLRCTLALQG